MRGKGWRMGGKGGREGGRGGVPMNDVGRLQILEGQKQLVDKGLNVLVRELLGRQDQFV